jgi:hypothetical protein
VAVGQISLDNPSSTPATLTGLTLTASGTGNDLTGISQVRVYLDQDNDGVADAGETLLGSATYSGNNGTAGVVLNLEIPATSVLNLVVVYDFTPGAPGGSYQAVLGNGSLAGTSANGALAFTGLPVMGAVVTIVPATATATSTATAVPTGTNSYTATRTGTPTSTASRTPTATRTVTDVPTSTQTNTPVPTQTFTAIPSETPTQTDTATAVYTATPRHGGETVIIHPNPADGTQPVNIRVPGVTGTSDVTVQIFTVAFRLVQQQVFEEVPLGTDIRIELKDRTGKPLASGLYYVVVSVDGKKTIGKLLLMR